MSAGATFTAAMVQMRTGLLPEPSLEQGISLIREAAAQGADYVLTPEVSNMMQLNRKALFEHLATEEDDLSLKAYRALAAELNIHLHIGSLALRFSPERAVNRSFLIAPDGKIAARYDKIHMFDVQLASGEAWRESSAYAPGEEVVTAETPVGRLGLAVCYDIRFPALFEQLGRRSCDAIAIPAAFTVPTGKAHWHVLQRARAIEASAYVVSAAQVGEHADGRRTYGHSLVIDPWGEVLLDMGGEEPGVAFAEIDPQRIADVRTQLPSLANRRPIPKSA